MARSKQLKRLEHWHHRLIDVLLAHPEKSGRQVAAHFGVSAVWISIVKNSPIFRAEFERRREMISRTVEADIATEATAVAKLSLAELRERIARGGDDVSWRELLDAATMGLKMLGYPERRTEVGSPGPGRGDFGRVDAKLLREARDDMRARQGIRGAIEREPATTLPGPRDGG